MANPFQASTMDVEAMAGHAAYWEAEPHLGHWGAADLRGGFLKILGHGDPFLHHRLDEVHSVEKGGERLSRRKRRRVKMALRVDPKSDLAGWFCSGLKTAALPLNMPRDTLFSNYQQAPRRLPLDLRETLPAQTLKANPSHTLTMKFPSTLGCVTLSKEQRE